MHMSKLTSGIGSTRQSPSHPLLHLRKPLPFPADNIARASRRDLPKLATRGQIRRFTTRTLGYDTRDMHNQTLLHLPQHLPSSNRLIAKLAPADQALSHSKPTADTSAEVASEKTNLKGPKRVQLRNHTLGDPSALVHSRHRRRTHRLLDKRIPNFPKKG
jgi:hypothetical protein